MDVFLSFVSSFVYILQSTRLYSGIALIKRCQFLKNARITKQTDNCLRPQIRGSYMAGTFLRFDFKLLLINWSIAALNSAVLKLADAPIEYTSQHWESIKLFNALHWRKRNKKKCFWEDINADWWQFVIIYSDHLNFPPNDSLVYWNVFLLILKVILEC